MILAILVICVLFIITMYFLNLFPSLDIFILFLFAVVVLLNLLFIKKEKLFINIISLYTSFVLIILLPMFIPQVSQWLGLHYLARSIAFVGLYLILTFIFWHSNLGEFSHKVNPTKFATSLAYRISITGLLFTSVLYFFPDSLKQLFGTLTAVLFMNLIAMFVWFVVPFFLAFAYRFRTRRGWME